MKTTIVVIALFLCGLPLINAFSNKKPKEYIANFEIVLELPEKQADTLEQINNYSFGRHCVDCSAGMYSLREDGVRRCSFCGNPDPIQP